jgi:hypothetical protein
VEDLDREVLAALTKDLFHLLSEDLAGAVVRIDDAIADLELDVRGGFCRLKIIQLLFR